MKKPLIVLCTVILLTGFTFNSFAAFIITHPPVTSATGEKPASTSVSSAFSDFKNLSRRDRKLRIREVKTEIKKFREQKREGNEPSTNQLLLVILAILLPPLAVYLHEGVINGKFWLDLVLTLLFFIPGVIYALIVVL